MKQMAIEWIGQDDDGLDPTWLEKTPAERFALAAIMGEQALRFVDKMRGTVTSRRMDKNANRFVPIEAEE